MSDALGDLKGRYRGERIFMVGNGPSLLRTPLDRLTGEHSFAMNRIALLYDRVSWRPTFFTCPTSNVKRPDWKRDILATVRLGIPCFVWDRLRDHFPPAPNIHYINCTQGDEVVTEAPDDWWSSDVADRVCKFGTSMLVALQIAVYMGFGEIYLLGCDMGFQKDRSHRKGWRFRGLLGRLSSRYRDPNHFDPAYGTPGLDAAALNANMLAAHRLAQRSSQRAGVRVYNATLGGDLEVYPRVDLEKVLA